MSWTPSDSRLYQELAAAAVPDRAEQMAALLTLLPFAPGESARVVELGCGEGFLSAAVLRAFPQVSVLALDGAPEMRSLASERLSAFGERAHVEAFDLAADDWWPHLDGADAVLSSLAIHHLDAKGKQRLFSAVARRLSPRGALLIADLVEPQRPEALELFAAGWDQSTERQASGRAYEKYLEAEWNIYRYPDPVDMPSPLFSQLLWLRDAGFAIADCFWLRAGHAVYGGYRSAERLGAAPIEFAAALQAVSA